MCTEVFLFLLGHNTFNFVNVVRFYHKDNFTPKGKFGVASLDLAWADPKSQVVQAYKSINVMGVLKKRADISEKKNKKRADQKGGNLRAPPAAHKYEDENPPVVGQIHITMQFCNRESKTGLDDAEISLLKPRTRIINVGEWADQYKQFGRSAVVNATSGYPLNLATIVAARFQHKLAKKELFRKNCLSRRKILAAKKAKKETLAMSGYGRESESALKQAGVAELFGE